MFFTADLDREAQHFVASYLQDQLASYLMRGRRYERLSLKAVRRVYSVAFTRNVDELFVGDGSSESRDQMNDSYVELAFFRHAAPPKLLKAKARLQEYASWRGVGPLIDGISRWRAERARPAS
jgi:hypothetical protein